MIELVLSAAFFGFKSFVFLSFYNWAVNDWRDIFITVDQHIKMVETDSTIGNYDGFFHKIKKKTNRRFFNNIRAFLVLIFLGKKSIQNRWTSLFVYNVCFKHMTDVIHSPAVGNVNKNGVVFSSFLEE